MVDKDGYRPNVGIILSNDQGQLLWAKRVGQDAWQFPQGGICVDETPEQAMYRELYEELGLSKEQVQVIASTQGWLKYRLPRRLVRRDREPVCIGQKQVWFLLRLLANDSKVRFDLCDLPEFEAWCWVDYWYPINAVVPFKRRVYRQALTHFQRLVCTEA